MRDCHQAAARLALRPVRGPRGAGPPAPARGPAAPPPKRPALPSQQRFAHYQQQRGAPQQGRAYAMAAVEEDEAAPDVIAGSILLHSFSVIALFYFGATQFSII